MPQCAVHRLRVAAASEPAARRFVTTLEDALRCATLPGDGRRVVVVRRLALGRVAHDAGTQRLGLLIEQRLARGEIAWAGVDEPPDPGADAVGFAGALEARVHLARRLVQGAPCDAWYWPLAVSEYRRDMAPREALRRVAQTLAALPEARVALPEWIAQLVDAAGVAGLCAALDERVARALLRDAGIVVPAGTAEVETIAPRARADVGAPASAPAQDVASPLPAPPAWLSAVLARAGRDEHVRAKRIAPATAQDGAPRVRSAPVATTAPVPAPDAARRSAIAPATALRTSPTQPASPAQTRPAGTPSPAASDIARPRAPTTTTRPDANGDWRPTACGGLLFLLPVLARAGLVQGDSPDADRAAALRVLRAALRRVRAAEDDAAWALLADLPTQRPSESRAAEERAQRELAAARGWLHRHARLGLVALVRRPARLALTATHIDLRFPLVGADVRVRRIGLDLDPGWLPWFGRVVAFQFAGRLP